MILIILGYLVGFVYLTTASWPLYIDLAVFGIGLILAVPYMIHSRSSMDFGGTMSLKCIVGLMAGSVSFILMFFWCGMSISIWWYILALILGIIACFIPGGFTIALYVLKNAAVISVLPTWVSVIMVVLDVISVITYVIAFTQRKNT